LIEDTCIGLPASLDTPATLVVRNLESCVEELRSDVVAGKSQVVLSDVEAMVLALGHIGRSLASLKGDRFTIGFYKLRQTRTVKYKVSKMWNQLPSSLKDFFRQVLR